MYIIMQVHSAQLRYTHSVDSMAHMLPYTYMYINFVCSTSGDENHLCRASLCESQDFFEGIKAWGW